VSDESGERRPTLRVISGGASDEEIAAVLAVILARSGESGEQVEAEQPPASTWADPVSRHRGVGTVFAPGRDGWRTSYWPR
jgi:hypothetical protein